MVEVSRWNWRPLHLLVSSRIQGPNTFSTSIRPLLILYESSCQATRPHPTRAKFPIYDDQTKKQQAKTYSSGDSLLVTHATTNPPIGFLNTGERTGTVPLNRLWPYVVERLFFCGYKRVGPLLLTSSCEVAGELFWPQALSSLPPLLVELYGGLLEHAQLISCLHILS
jgi:hypothetical protein